MTLERDFMEERLILVDENDIETGIGTKLAVHKKGIRHRAFSIFLWNGKGELLLQRRAQGKYHSAGLWANTCCGHPRPGEQVGDAAVRRLNEELGMSANLQSAGTYSYFARLPNSLIENELVHLYWGYAHDKPELNPDEVDMIRWVTPEDLLIDFALHPDSYAAWFALYMVNIPSRILSANPV